MSFIIPIGIGLARTIAPQLLKYGVRRSFGSSKYINRLQLSRSAKFTAQNIIGGSATQLTLAPFNSLFYPKRQYTRSNTLYLNSSTMPYGYYPRRMYGGYRRRYSRFRRRFGGYRRRY